MAYFPSVGTHHVTYVKKHIENLDHLLFHCPFLTRYRDLVRGWLGQLGVESFNKHNIIEMTRGNPGFENYCTMAPSDYTKVLNSTKNLNYLPPNAVASR